LFEALVSVALMGMIVTCLSAVTGQWLPNWRRGFARVQGVEALDVGLRRVIADLEAAEFVSANNQSRRPFFIGDAVSVTFVRSAIGPDAAPGLEFVRLAPTIDARGLVLARARARFTPTAADPPSFGGPVAVIRAPWRISFAYAGADGVWRDSWRDAPALPAAIRVEAREGSDDAVASIVTEASPRVDTPAECAGQKSVATCLANLGAARNP
jgi:general secretion pathway protein J